MSERYDYIAINKLGVYAICEDLPGDPGGVAAEFIARADAKGNRVELVTVEEAVARHKAYIALISSTSIP